MASNKNWVLGISAEGKGGQCVELNLATSCDCKLQGLSRPVQGSLYSILWPLCTAFKPVNETWKHRGGVCELHCRILFHYVTKLQFTERYSTAKLQPLIAHWHRRTRVSASNSYNVHGSTVDIVPSLQAGHRYSTKTSVHAESCTLTSYTSLIILRETRCSRPLNVKQGSWKRLNACPKQTQEPAANTGCVGAAHRCTAGDTCKLTMSNSDWYWQKDTCR